MDFAEGDEMLTRFQNPAEADKIMKIEKDLEEVSSCRMRVETGTSSMSLSSSRLCPQGLSAILLLFYTAICFRGERNCCQVDGRYLEAGREHRILDEQKR